MLYRVRSWLAAVALRKRMERDMADELDFHLAARADDLMDRGLSRAEASRRARLDFGAPERYKEECRESRGLRLLNELRGDVLYALRGLRRSPGFAAVVVLSLALGIGANTAMFSVINGVLLRPLPYRDPDRLVYIRESMPPSLSGMSHIRWLPVVNPLLRLDELHSFEDLFGMDRAIYQLVDIPDPESLDAAWVTPNLCSFLGVQPVIGRCFSIEDAVSRAQVTLLSSSLWQRQFGGDPNIVGKSIPLRDYEANKRFTVIGVLPPGFEIGWKSDLWMPISESENYRRRQRAWTPSRTFAKLKSGVSVAQARSELLAMQRSLFPKEYEGAGGNQIIVQSAIDFIAQPVKLGLTVLLCVVGLVLLITCANVANLLLGKGAGRAREIAVRESLGAGRFRVCRQLLTEALSLALLGGALGLVAAHWILKGVKALDFQRLPRIAEIQVDWRVLLFTAVVAIVSGMLFGLAPALRLSRLDLADAMKAGGAGAMGGRRQQRLMNGLVVFEVALCVVAMVGSGLLINSFFRLKGIDPGFRADQLLVASLDSPPANPKAQFREILERVQSVPGVRAAGLTDNPPPYHVHSIQDFKRPGTNDAFGPGGLRANARAVSPGYFHTMGIPILHGRTFDSRDQANSPRVIIVSAVMAKRFWPAGDAIGKTLILREYRKEALAEIIGIARDVRQAGLRDLPEDQMYSSYTQTDNEPQDLVVRTIGDPALMTSAIKNEVRAVDHSQTFKHLDTMQQLLAGEVAEPRFYMVLLSAYGVLALALTTLGIGGLIAYAVSRRTQEIGLRISFGATRYDLLGMFATGSLKLVVVGLSLGILGSLAVTRFTRSLLFEVTPTDPVTFTLVAVLLTVVSLAACLSAAFRSTAIQPTVVLRHE